MCLCVCVCVCVCVEHTSPSSPDKYIHLFDTKLPLPVSAIFITCGKVSFGIRIRLRRTSTVYRKSISSKSKNSTNGCLSRVELHCVHLHLRSEFDCIYCYTDQGNLLPLPERKETFVSGMGSGRLRLQPAYSSQGTGVSSAAESGRDVRVASHLRVVSRLRINSATTPTASTQYMTCTLTFSMSLT